MDVHLLDGTYELFRVYYGAPSSTAPDGREVGATRALLRSWASMLAEPGVTHVAAAFDTVIESFRNEMFDGYKTGEGIDPLLFAQFPLAERASHALGIVVWSMIDMEADDGMAAGAARYADDPRVDRVLLCSPDKDLTQCVRADGKVVCFDRRKREVMGVEEVKAKFGVAPESIPDYLALVGDAADGIPGIPKWGAKSAGAVLARYGHIEQIPDDEGAWDVKVRGAKALAESLASMREEAALYRRLATLRIDVLPEESLEELEWKGARRAELTALCEEIGETRLLDRIQKLRDD